LAIRQTHIRGDPARDNIQGDAGRRSGRESFALSHGQGRLWVPCPSRADRPGPGRSRTRLATQRHDCRGGTDCADRTNPAGAMPAEASGAYLQNEPTSEGREPTKRTRGCREGGDDSTRVDCIGERAAVRGPREPTKRTHDYPGDRDGTDRRNWAIMPLERGTREETKQRHGLEALIPRRIREGEAPAEPHLEARQEPRPPD